MWPMTACQALISIISFNSLKELDGRVIGEAANRSTTYKTPKIIQVPELNYLLITLSSSQTHLEPKNHWKFTESITFYQHQLYLVFFFQL